MVASDLDTLHKFAKALGLRREWFQNKEGKPHYDICSYRIRMKAWELGAQTASTREIILFLKKHYQ